MTLAQMQSVEPTITREVFDVLGVEKSVRSRMSYGGTAPDNVRQQAQSWAQRLARDEDRMTAKIFLSGPGAFGRDDSAIVRAKRSDSGSRGF